MDKEKDITTKDKINPKKEDSTMMASTVVKIDNNMFNRFLNANKEKINSIVPKNPSIAIDDEWRQEDFWDEDTKGNNK